MTLSEEERGELVASARHLLDRASSSTRVRAVVETADALDLELWEQFVELGWNATHIPEELGGAGAGYEGLAVVLHEMGRHLTPSPFLASAVLATEALVRAPNADLGRSLLRRLVAGDIRATIACAGPSGRYEPDGWALRWEAGRREVTLAGQAGYVLDADLADVIIVAARSEDGTPLLATIDARAPGVSVTRTPTVDHTRRLFALSLDGLVLPEDRLLAQPGEESRQLLERVLNVGAVAVACDAVGAAERVTEMTAEYAKQRHQFGRPIGSFQAVKHHCADMVIAVEAGRAAVAAAFESLDLAAGDAASAADVVASYCGPAASKVCGLAIRVHGGIGFTWEHDAHMFLKRAKLDEMLLGSPLWHRRRLARRVFPTVTAAWDRPALAG